MFWGAIASGYVIYGWKQRSMIPFGAGLVMSVVACFCHALTMSAVCIVLIFAVWWLVRQGY